MSDRLRPLLAEALGSALLFACVIGSGIMAERLAGGNIAIALLGNTLATAAMLFSLITVFGPVSGAQFNPAVTLVMASRGAMPWAHVGPVIAAQLLGGGAGVLLAHGMFDLPLIQISHHARHGLGQWLGEGTATFMLILTIIGTLKARPGWVAPAVGATITAGYWFTSSTSFANPAITCARALTDSFAGIAPGDVTGFILAQAAGAALAALFARWLWPEAQ